MKDVLTHELIHAYDHCRAHVDWQNIKHLACSEVGIKKLTVNHYLVKYSTCLTTTLVHIIYPPGRDMLFVLSF